MTRVWTVAVVEIAAAFAGMIPGPTAIIFLNVTAKRGLWGSGTSRSPPCRSQHRGDSTSTCRSQLEDTIVAIAGHRILADAEPLGAAHPE